MRNLRAQPNIGLVLAILFLFAFGIALFICHASPVDALVNRHFRPTLNTDGALWQVQTTFLSVGFAGLAIATQLFVDSPLAFGASRTAVLKFIYAPIFACYGTGANILIALETIWIPSNGGAFLAFILGLLPTTMLLVASSVRLVGLFGNQILLDRLIRKSTQDSYVNRLRKDQKTFEASSEEITRIQSYFESATHNSSNQRSIEIFSKQPNCVVSGYKIKNFEKAARILRIDTFNTTTKSANVESSYKDINLEFLLAPGNRTRSEKPIIQIRANQLTRPEAISRAIRILESSVIYKPESYVTLDETTDRDLTQLKDTISQSLRNGQYAVAKRALELLDQLLREIWQASAAKDARFPQGRIAGGSALRHITRDSELDVILGARTADLLLDNAMTRALTAPESGSKEYIDDSLRSFVRMWSDLLKTNDSQFDRALSRIVICLQNLALFAYSMAPEKLEAQPRASWALVELIKLALDGQSVPNAVAAADQLATLSESKRNINLSSQSLAGQLVLLSWIDFLEPSFSDEHVDLEPLKNSLAISASKKDLLNCYDLLQDRTTPFSRWEHWETSTSAFTGVHVLRFPEKVTTTLYALLCNAPGPLPKISRIDDAFLYRSFLDKCKNESDPRRGKLQEFINSLETELANWDRFQNQLLLDEPIQNSRVDELKDAFITHYKKNSILSNYLTKLSTEHMNIIDSDRRLGINIRVPKIYFVQKGFNNTFADAAQLGQTLATGFIDSEEDAIIDKLRELTTEFRNGTTAAISNELQKLGNDRKNFIFIIPFGGVGHYEDWYAPALQKLLKDVKVVESSSLPDDEAILFARHTSLELLKLPDPTDGLKELSGTEISFGLFDEGTASEDEPSVRIQLAEKFDLVPNQLPTIYRFHGNENN